VRRGGHVLNKAAAAAGGFGGILLFNDEERYDRFARGVFYGVVPNAFLNAYVYNSVKSPVTGDETSRLSVSPYVAAYRVGRDAPTPVYGLSLSF
jgi:hypothetical protein